MAGQSDDVADVGCLELNARNVGNIKKSGKLLNCSIIWKVECENNRGVTKKLLIASTVSKNSCIWTQKDAAGVDIHAWPLGDLSHSLPL